MMPTVQETHWSKRCLPVIPQISQGGSSQDHNGVSFLIGNTSSFPSSSRPCATQGKVMGDVAYVSLKWGTLKAKPRAHHHTVFLLMHRFSVQGYGKKNKPLALSFGAENKQVMFVVWNVLVVRLVCLGLTRPGRGVGCCYLINMENRYIGLSEWKTTFIY